MFDLTCSLPPEVPLKQNPTEAHWPVEVSVYHTSRVVDLQALFDSTGVAEFFVSCRCCKIKHQGSRLRSSRTAIHEMATTPLHFDAQIAAALIGLNPSRPVQGAFTPGELPSPLDTINECESPRATRGRPSFQLPASRPIS